MFVERVNPTADLLHCRNAAQEELHARATETAMRMFGRRVFVRAVVEVSNFCRENCSYCGMRRDNRSLTRLRANPEEVAEIILRHRPASVTDINIQTGEDPVAVREVVVPLVRILRRETSLGISVCLGTLSPALYAELQEAGACMYIMKFEMADPKRYARLHAPGSFAERIANIRHLAATGWRVSSGFIAGLPAQTAGELVENLNLARELPLSGCSVSPFIPGDETPLAENTMADVNLTLNCMAALRLIQPDWIIPAVSALNLASPEDGYRRGLRTGANLVTINMTPGDVRRNYLLYKRDRVIMTEERILNAIAAENLQCSDESLAAFFQRHPRIDPAPSANGAVSSCEAA